MANQPDIRFTLNDKPVKLKIKSSKLLVDVLREDLGLTGTKKSCGIGECGACSVIVDNKVLTSCIVPVAKVNGCNLLTIEGLSRNLTLHPIQQSFINNDAVQCGYCTPGMVITTKALLDRNPHPTRDEVKVALSGNICRCTGYVKIIEAVLEAAYTMNNNKEK